MLILIVIDSVNNIGIIVIIIIVVNVNDNDLVFSVVMFSVDVLEGSVFGMSVVKLIVIDGDFEDIIIYVLLGKVFFSYY